MALPMVIGGALAAANAGSIGTRLVGFTRSALGLVGLGSLIAPAAVTTVDNMEEDKIMGIDKSKLPVIAGAAVLAYIVLKK